MNTKKAKQGVALALDAAGMRGRFTVRDVAEEAARATAHGDLSLTDQQEAHIKLFMTETKTQMKVPLRSDLKEKQFDELPERYWPILNKLTKTICVTSGQNAYHVLTLYATEDDLSSFLEIIDLMERRVRTARNSVRDIRNLLRAEGAETLWQVISGERAHLIAVAS